MLESRATAILALVVVAQAAQAQYVYEDISNPGGLPDFSQLAEPICASAAFSNSLWLLDAQGFGGLANNKRPYTHTDVNDIKKKWGADSTAATLSLADSMYGKKVAGARSKGLGMIPGAVDYLKAHGKSAYDKKTNPNGVHVIYRTDKAKIFNTAKDIISRFGGTSSVAFVHWLNAAGQKGTVKNANDQDVVAKHALTVAAIDTTNKKMAVSNPWGDHATPTDANDPVDKTYYDDLVYNQAAATAGRLTFDQVAGSNQDLMTRTDTATFTASQLEVYGLVEFKKGGSPSIVLDSVASNVLRYTLDNPDEVDIMSHAYLLFDPAAVGMVDLLARFQTGLLGTDWSASLLNPNSAEDQPLFDALNVTDPNQTPDYLLTDWESNAAGIRLDSVSGGLSMGSSFSFELNATGLSLSAFDSIYLFSSFDRTLTYGAGITPVPEPGSFAALGLGILALRRRERTA